MSQPLGTTTKFLIFADWLTRTCQKRTRLEHLFRGLRPTLFRKSYPLKPKTCEEFLALVKSYTEASLMSDTRGWKDTTTEPQKPHEQLPNLSVVSPDQQADFMKTMRELIQDTCEKFISKEKNEQVKSRGPFKPKGRTLTGKPQCFYCKKSGHIARNCFKYPESEQYKGPPNDAASGGNLPINLAVPDTLEEKFDHPKIFVFNLNPARLIKEAEKCGKVTATALIDTGAAVTVISPELLEKTEFVKKPLVGPKIRLVNGQTLSPQSTADIAVTHRGKTIKEQSQESRLISRDSQEIPAYTVKQIPATVSNKIEGLCILTPSGPLLATTSLSTGPAIVRTDLENIPVANLSLKTVWLEKGVTLEILEKHSEAKETEETQEVSTLDDSVDDQNSDTEKEEWLKHLKGRIGENLTKQEKEETVKILKQFVHCFALNGDDLGYCCLDQ
ncbi:hypothetical protein OUZ56_017167 [Daphnia magna]|uniref:CCHC-type domain-containing protein n=1 Tax=Daphnia magna TaxID=35525 RepID=A0ABR0ASD0_9CRUS|nr:hypothetical protein OUZ56_017167 [Daphnia magna]